ncbi:MAG: TetR/AcrR family transcriptional regulator [Sphingobacteriaceae bacterium]
MRIRDENKEQAICEKAIEMVVAKGFDGLSMQKLAKEANVSPATIYIYFKDREDLILQLCMRESQKMVEATFEDFNTEMDFVEGMRLQWKNRAAYWLKNPFSAQFLEQAKHTNYGEQAFEYTKSQFASAMGKFLRKAVKNGEVVELTTEVFWATAFSPLYTLIKFHLAGKGMAQRPFVLDDNILDQTLKLVIKALTPTK